MGKERLRSLKRGFLVELFSAFLKRDRLILHTKRHRLSLSLDVQAVEGHYAYAYAVAVVCP